MRGCRADLSLRSARPNKKQAGRAHVSKDSGGTNPIIRVAEGRAAVTLTIRS
jgi:hypothetical protein